MKNWIGSPRVGGTATRQAHVALPPGTFERAFGAYIDSWKTKP